MPIDSFSFDRYKPEYGRIDPEVMCGGCGLRLPISAALWVYEGSLECYLCPDCLFHDVCPWARPIDIGSVTNWLQEGF